MQNINQQNRDYQKQLEEYKTRILTEHQERLTAFQKRAEDYRQRILAEHAERTKAFQKQVNDFQAKALAQSIRLQQTPVVTYQDVTGLISEVIGIDHPNCQFVFDLGTKAVLQNQRDLGVILQAAGIGIAIISEKNN